MGAPANPYDMAAVLRGMDGEQLDQIVLRLTEGTASMLRSSLQKWFPAAAPSRTEAR